MIQTSATSNNAFERGIAPLFRILTPEQAVQIANCHADEPLQQRIEELASKCNEGELSEEELGEYEGYVRANKFVAVFQTQARRRFMGHHQPEGTATVGLCGPPSN